MFELISNCLLLVFLVFSYFTHVLEAKIPKKFRANSYNLMPDVWPKVIILLLVVCIVVNISRIVRKNKDNPDFTISKFCENSVAFLKSRMFIGMAIVVVAALMIETFGFVVTSAFVLFAYGFLIGERKVARLAIVTVVLSLLLHVVFSGLLDVTLPRGTIPFLRNFALMLEGLV